MRQAVIYPSTQAHLIIKGGKEKCRSLSTEHIVSIGKRGDKAAILQIFENKCNEEEIASQAIGNIRKRQLDEIRKRMPENKQGYEFKINGHTFVAFIRRLTPSECAELQTIPHDYEFVSSETQQYHGIGNGWNIETIKHIFQFIPEEIKKDMKVLSLFDGISGGQMALNGIGAKVSTYLASEIDKHAIANTMHNFPNTIQLGSVTELNVDEMVQQYGIPNILIGGSPCQGFSMSGKLKGASTSHGEEIYTLDRYLELKARGFEFDDDPFEPPTKKSDIPQPKDRGIVIDDILQDEVGEKYYLKDYIVGKLLDRTEKAKLKDYIGKTQMTLDELSEEIHRLEPQLSKEEIDEIAKNGLKQEVERLKGIYDDT